LQKTLDHLITLQNIDSQLQQLEEDRGDLPQQVKERSQELEELQQKLQTKQSQKDVNEKERTSLLGEAELQREKLKKYKSQLYQVQTNKEYDAITTEIDSSTEKIDEMEFRALELEETNEALDNEINDLKEGIQEKQQQLDVLKKDLDAKMAQSKEQEEKLKKERQEVVKNLSPQMLNTYERIRKARNGVAVAVMRSGACSECSSRIPPQRRLEIRNMNQLYVCEVCGRMLVWDESEESNIQSEE